MPDSFEGPVPNSSKGFNSCTLDIHAQIVANTLSSGESSLSYINLAISHQCLAGDGQECLSGNRDGVPPPRRPQIAACIEFEKYHMSQFAVILPAAGQSSRFIGFQRKKPFVELNGRPVWVRTAEHFLNRPDVSQTILVVAPEDLEWFHETFKANLSFMDITVVAGGTSRGESVRNGISAIVKPVEFIAVHDAARPLLTAEWIDQIFAAAKTHQAAIPGLKVSSTVKRVGSDAIISATVDRTGLVEAQTPQVFATGLLQTAISNCRNLAAATDEASLLEAISQPVHVIDGWPMNIKITTNEDLQLAEVFLNSLPESGWLGGTAPVCR